MVEFASRILNSMGR